MSLAFIIDWRVVSHSISFFSRTPYGTTPTGGGITPGAMSMAAGTPYARTPVGAYGAAVGGGGVINTPYTPSGQTPILTPYNTPGPSMTPRHHPNHSGIQFL